MTTHDDEQNKKTGGKMVSNVLILLLACGSILMLILPLMVQSPVDAGDSKSSLIKQLSGMEKFDEFLLNDFALVCFSAQYCAPCRKVQPHLESLASGQAGKLHVEKVDTDEEREISRNQGIRGTPTIKIFYQGQCRKPLLGCYTEKELLDALRKAVPEYNSN